MVARQEQARVPPGHEARSEPDRLILAFERGASDAAVAYLRRALEEPPAPKSRASVLLELGRAETRAREPAAVEHLEQAL